MKNNTIEYLSVEDVLKLHAEQIEEFGGAHGIREPSLLESAVHRPRVTFDDVDLYSTLQEKAAALIHGIITNYPFIDGNKRTGMYAGLTFLDMHGVVTKTSQKEVEEAALNIAKKKWAIEEITKWIEEISAV